MSGLASSSTSSGSTSLSATLSEKLTRDNFLIWLTQVLPDIRGAQLYGYLDGSILTPEKELKATDKDGKEVTISNPKYARWIAMDQCVLSYLVRNMSREIFTQMVGKTIAVEVWTTVIEMFSSQSKARIVQLRSAVNKAQKGDKSASIYFNHIKNIFRW
jgi:hypothetical protein